MSRTSISRRIASASPVVLTAIWVVVGIWSIIAPTWSFAPALILISTICGWAWAIHAVSIARTPQEGHPRWTGWIFLAPPLLAVIAEIAGLPTDNSPVAFLLFGTLFLGLWRAAQALEYADRGAKPVTAGRIAGTMFLLFFAIVGVWRLRQRILRVSGPSAQPA